MQKIPPIICLSIFYLTSLCGQEFKITGTVVDSETKEVLEATTVYIESPKDSSLVTYTISDEKGFFEIKDRTHLKELNLFFSFNGYKTLAMKIPRKSSTELGLVHMEQQAEQLKGIAVVGDRVPITIKKDTLEFNADSFKTRPDATVEELLKRLPGVEVDSDGKITVNGKEVNQVLVNGQVFF